MDVAEFSNLLSNVSIANLNSAYYNMFVKFPFLYQHRYTGAKRMQAPAWGTCTCVLVLCYYLKNYLPK